MSDRAAPPTPKPASRRGRPPIISDDRLLEAAREVFLSRGIRATTAEVAERAHVSEGTIFHRYKTKDALFRAAMQFDPEQIPKLLDALAPHVGEGDLRATLVALALRILSFGRVAVPMMMMAWSNPGGEYSLEKMLVDDTMMANKRLAEDRWLRGLRVLFDSEIERGRLAPVSSEILTRMFVGTLRDYCMRELLANTEARISPKEFAESVVDLVLRAAKPTADVASTAAIEPRPSRARLRARSAR
jgi:AcrR family transcriptional regulator